MTRDQLWTNFVRSWRGIAREIRWPGISTGTYHSTWCTCCDVEKDNACIEEAAARHDSGAEW